MVKYKKKKKKHLLRFGLIPSITKILQKKYIFPKSINDT